MKLNFELVPAGCWKYNLRNILTKKQWDFIKHDVKSQAIGRWVICGGKCSRLEAHEVWHYDEDNGIIILKDVVAICRDCHSVIHIGRTSLKGDSIKAENHYMKVNNCSYVEMRKHLGIANEINQRRNLISDWKLDISWLKKYT